MKDEKERPVHFSSLIPHPSSFILHPFGDSLTLLLQKICQRGRFQTRLFQPAESVFHDQHGRIVTAAAYGAAQVVKIGELQRHRAAQMPVQVTAALFAACQHLFQSQGWILLFNGHRCYNSEKRSDVGGPSLPIRKRGLAPSLRGACPLFRIGSYCHARERIYPWP